STPVAFPFLFSSLSTDPPPTAIYTLSLHDALPILATSVVPGITSSVAVPASQGIPVTKRGVSESFWVITGTTSSGQLSRDLRLAVQSTATVVVLMATKKLAEIVTLYKQHGKSSVSIALVQNGTTDGEKVV